MALITYNGKLVKTGNKFINRISGWIVPASVPWQGFNNYGFESFSSTLLTIDSAVAYSAGSAFIEAKDEFGGEEWALSNNEAFSINIIISDFTLWSGTSPYFVIWSSLQVPPLIQDQLANGVFNASVAASPSQDLYFEIRNLEWTGLPPVPFDTDFQATLSFSIV